MGINSGSGGIAENINNPFGIWYKNLEDQYQFFAYCIGSNLKSQVFYGSSCVYPKDSINPIKEECLGNGKVEETSEAYAYAKLSGIAGCKAYNKKHGEIRIVCLIPATVYGPGGDFGPSGHVLNSLINKIHAAKASSAPSITLLGSGRPLREFIYCDDLKEATTFAIKNKERMENTHYNVGSGEEISIKELARLVALFVGYEGVIEFDNTSPDGAPRKLLDSSKFKALGWQSKTDLYSGIRLTYEWYLKEIDGKP